MKPKEISKLNKHVMIVIEALHNQREYISEFKLRDLLCMSEYRDRDPVKDKNKMLKWELDTVLEYLIDKGSIVIKNSNDADCTELPIQNYKLSFEMFLLIENFLAEDKKTLIKNWVESKPEISSTLKNALLEASKDPEFKIKSIKDISENHFLKMRNIGKHSWNEFRRLTGNS